MYLALWESRRWRLPATPALIFPVAVILKRFLAPDFVFSFGISLRSGEAPSSGVLMSRPGMPWARLLRREGLIRERGAQGKMGPSGSVLDPAQPLFAAGQAGAPSWRNGWALAKASSASQAAVIRVTVG